MSNQLLDIASGPARSIDGPNYNELERMEEITARVKLLQIEKQQMDEIENVKERWTRQGFNLAMTTHYEGWQVTMWHSLPGLHRPPFGRGATLREALAAAEADLKEMLAAKGKAKV